MKRMKIVNQFKVAIIFLMGYFAINSVSAQDDCAQCNDMCPNDIITTDFNNMACTGDGTFQSGLTNRCNSMWIAGNSWRIVNNAQGGSNHFDNIGPQEGNQFMICDGRDRGTTSVWSSNYQVVQGQDYCFRFWAVEASATTNDPILNVLINSNAGLRTFTDSDVNGGNWRELCYFFTAAQTEMITINILNTPTIIGTTSGNDFGIDNIQLSTFNMPTVDIQIDDEFCLNEPIIADGSASTNDNCHFWGITESDQWWNTTWDPNTTWKSGWITGEAGTIDLMQLSNGQLQAGKYYRVFLYAGDCQCHIHPSITRLIHILEPPVANAGNDIYLCESNCYYGTTVTLGGYPAPDNSTPTGSRGTPPYTYQWQGPGLSDPNVANPTISSCPCETRKYKVTVTDSKGCSDIDEINVYCSHMDAGPDKEVCDNDPVGVQIGSPPIPGATYVWTPSTGLSNPNISNPFANPSTTTIYTVCMSYQGSYGSINCSYNNPTPPSSLCDDVKVSVITCSVIGGKTGDFDEEQVFSYAIFPTISSGLYNIELNQAGEEVTTVTVMNISGQVVEIRQLKASGTYQLDIKGNAPGMYFLRVQNEEQVELKKIILQ